MPPPAIGPDRGASACVQGSATNIKNARRLRKRLPRPAFKFLLPASFALQIRTRPAEVPLLSQNGFTMTRMTTAIMISVGASFTIRQWRVVFVFRSSANARTAIEK